MGVDAIRVSPREVSVRQRRVFLEHLQAYAFVLPALAVLAMFHVLPAFAALAMSTMRWGVVPERFVGIDNYVQILDPAGLRFGEFMNSIAVTAWYVLLTVPVEMAVGLLVAYVLFQKVYARFAYRTVYFLPYITSTVAASVVFLWIFNQNYGLLNWFIELIGIGPQKWLQEPTGVFELAGAAIGLELTGWLGGPSLALVGVAIFTVWHFVGLHVVIFMAGLANISREYYEAARIDGANERQIFFGITLPLLAPTTFFVLIIATIGAMRAFNPIYVLTQGGPLDTTKTLGMEIFQTFFQRANIGVGAAMAFILVGLILALTFVQFRVVGRRVHYD